jgi:hypothetical protein
LERAPREITRRCRNTLSPISAGDWRMVRAAAAREFL